MNRLKFLRIGSALTECLFTVCLFGSTLSGLAQQPPTNSSNQTSAPKSEFIAPGIEHLQNYPRFHEGTYDFYDDRGNLLRQIDMHNQIEWELVDDPE